MKYIVWVLILISGCVQVGPKTLPTQQCPKLTVPVCPHYSMPGIAETVTIKIRGNIVEADAGGEKLIREYARAQQLLQ